MRANSMASTKYKRRSVSAVRDFPPGCGRFPSFVSPNPDQGTASLGSTESSVGVSKNGDVVEIGNGGSQNNDGRLIFEKTEIVPNQENGGEVDKLEFVEPMQLDQNLEGLNNLENSETKDLVQGVIEVGGSNDVVMPLEVMAVDQNLEGLNVSENSEVKHLLPGVIDVGGSKDLVMPLDRNLEGSNNLEVKELVQGVIDVGVSKDLNNVGVDGVDRKEGMIRKKYPPRRRVSAVRDFPPFCGSNAALLERNANPMVVASVENNGLGVEEKRDKDIVEIDSKKSENVVQDGYVPKSSFKRTVVDEAQAESEEPASNSRELPDIDEFGGFCTNEMTGTQRDVPAKSIDYSRESLRSKRQLETEVVPVSSKKDITNLKEATGNKFSATYKVGKTFERKSSDLSINTEDIKETEVWLERYCGAGERKHKKKPNSASGTKRKEVEGEYKKKKPSLPGKSDQHRDLMVIGSKEDGVKRSEKSVAPLLASGARNLGVNLPPSRPSANEKGNQNDSTVSRNKVRETLRLFQVICRKILQEEEAKSKGKGTGFKRIDYLASRMLKENGKYVNTGKQIIGRVPGVEVGDEFIYRVELNIIGLHRQTQGGIDYVKQGNTLLATSIVASGGYDDHTDNSDVLIYTGSGGNVMGKDKEPEDQKLERGNLALKNSMDARNPVRVIRGEAKTSDSNDSRAGRIYVYDGLYLVEKCWQEMGPHGKLVYKFRLARIPGQPELAWKLVKKSRKFKVRDGLCADDISHGKELIPICAVNTVDDEKPPAFKYDTRIIYPDWFNLTSPQGCTCTNGCSESGKCSCVEKNGGEIPYNHNGAIVEAKSMVYECGPLCKCPPSCHNRVTQHGIKFQLEIFKTETRGWGVRSLTSIPSGSFICEYAGELLEEKEAEERTGNDDYLFDIGNNSTDNSLWDGLSTIMPDQQSRSAEVVTDSSFTIDAAHFGNVGRFINHSCSPNLYAQNVLYDHDDKRIPHIMFFAVENIPPLQELTYDYNYMIDHVFDSAGKIKKKSCYCGSSECRGRMY